jgi:hypothetical protein
VAFSGKYLTGRFAPTAADTADDDAPVVIQMS